MSERLPNFLHIGPGKTGSTWLHEILITIRRRRRRLRRPVAAPVGRVPHRPAGTRTGSGLSGLIADDEPAPVRVLRANARSAFVLAADHAGNRIPRALGDLGVGAAERQRHIAWDIGIAAVTEALSQLVDATAVLQTYSRLVIDCNRNPGHPTSIPPVSEATPIPGNENLSDADREARRRAIFDPYHTAITGILDARAGRRTILVAMHSFTPVFKGVARAVEVGVLPGAASPVERDGDLRDPRQGPDQVSPRRPRGPARHLRRASPPTRGRLPRGARSDRGRAAARAPHHRRELPHRARADQLLGLQLDRLPRPPRRVRRDRNRGEQIAEFKGMVSW